jgi:5-deoxy-D-glucuronate isomerase
MIGVIVIMNDKGPLMFINTVNSQVDEIPQQQTFDSRDSKTKQIRKESNATHNKLKFLEERKLNNIIEMYNKDRPVLCNIIIKGQEVLGIPYHKDDLKLFVKTGEEKVEEINLSDIEDIIIIKF